MAPSVPNPNWPTLFAEGCFGGNPYYLPGILSVYTDMAPRLYKQWSIRRGKQFELDAVQPGEFHGQWANTDGALDPSNTTSYYSPGVVPYRGYRMRAQYPSSVNMLGGDQATGGEVTPLAVGTSGVGYGVNSSPSMSAFTVTSSASAWQGTQVWQSTGTTSFGSALLDTNNVPIQGVFGTTYTFSVYARSVTTGANPGVTIGVVWISASGNPVSQTFSGTTTLTGSPTAAWTRLTYTATVPGASFGLYPVAAQWEIQVASAPSGTWSFQVDGLQAEAAAAASAFSIPGTNYPVYSGMIERYPQSWDYSGTYGVVSPVCVDTMALLSQTILNEAFVMDVVTTSPQWFFPLNDAAAAAGLTQTFQEQAGRTPAAGVFSSGYGAGTLSPGSGITAATLPGGQFYGTNGPIVTVNNPTANQGTVVDLTPAGITGPPSSGGWTRMLAFRTAVTSNNPIMAAATSGYNPFSVGYNSAWYLYLGGATGNVGVSMYTDNGTHAGLTASAVSNDNNWHIAFFSLSSSGLTLSLYVDGVQYQTTSGTDMHAVNTNSDAVGSDMYRFAGLTNPGVPGWVGDVALYAQWNTELSPSVVSSLSDSFKTAYQGERSDQRYSRILSWAGYVGASTLDSGQTTSMNYANDVSGVDALTALSNVVDTEGGRHFVGVDGTINFQSRKRFFQAVTPVWTFGENQTGGEIPYTDIAWDFDPTRISNQIAVTQLSNSQLYYANDTTSQLAYGVRNLARDNQSTNAEEVRESAYYYLSRYKDPHMRIQNLKVDVASNPALWPSVLSFELGQYVAINRRDEKGARPTITQYGFIEQITHTGDDKGAWTVELQVSPGPSVTYGTFTGLHTTLASAVSSGASTVTINALPDAATNPVRSELTDGQLITLSNGATYEFLNIAVGGVQNQNAGYSTATVKFTSNLVNSYPSGASFLEAYGGATYDSLAVFDSMQFSY